MNIRIAANLLALFLVATTSYAYDVTDEWTKGCTSKRTPNCVTDEVTKGLSFDFLLIDESEYQGHRAAIDGALSRGDTSFTYDKINPTVHVRFNEQFIIETKLTSDQKKNSLFELDGNSVPNGDKVRLLGKFTVARENPRIGSGAHRTFDGKITSFETDLTPGQTESVFPGGMLVVNNSAKENTRFFMLATIKIPAAK